MVFTGQIRFQYFLLSCHDRKLYRKAIFSKQRLLVQQGCLIFIVKMCIQMHMDHYISCYHFVHFRLFYPTCFSNMTVVYKSNSLRMCILLLNTI